MSRLTPQQRSAYLLGLRRARAQARRQGMADQDEVEEIEDQLRSVRDQLARRRLNDRQDEDV